MNYDRFMTKNMSSRCTAINKHWLAGLIDGDGGFYLSKKGYGCLEITVETADMPLLQSVQKVYGGSLKYRGQKRSSVRLRLHNKKILIPVLQDVNGLLKHKRRKEQYKLVAAAYGIACKTPEIFDWNTGYFCGLFDSDGKITLGIKALT
jgi:LAGLIDADG endonuclease